MTRLIAWAAGALLVAGIAGCGGGAPKPAATVTESAPASFLVASADTALKSGDPEGARRLLARALQAAPESAFVHIANGRYLTAIRRYKDAKESFDKAASLEPLSPEPHVGLGRAYQQAGDLEAAARAYAVALRLDPNHHDAAAALGPILGARYEAAGIPGEYALLRQRTTVSRGELAVVLAVELGIDPDRVAWRSDAPPSRAEDEELSGAWGNRWAKAAASRDWIEPYADGRYHLEDPVTRASLALTLAVVERQWRPAGGGASGATGGAPSSGTIGALGTSTPSDSVWMKRVYPDLGARHYLARAAARAVFVGLPERPDGRFDPWAAASGNDVFAAARGLARRVGAAPVVSGEPPLGGVVK